MPTPAKVRRVLGRLRDRTPLRWKAVVLLGLATIGFVTGQVLAPTVLLVAVAAHAVLTRLDTRDSRDRTDT